MTIDWQALCAAWGERDWQRRHYLDGKTGTVVCVTEAVRAQLERVYDDVGEDAAAPCLTSADLQLAHAVEMDDERYWRVPFGSAEPRKVTACDQFAETCEAALKQLLWAQLERTGVNGVERFLRQFEPAEFGRWQRYWLEQQMPVMRRWVEEQTR